MYGMCLVGIVADGEDIDPRTGRPYPHLTNGMAKRMWIIGSICLLVVMIGTIALKCLCKPREVKVNVEAVSAKEK